MLFNSLEFAVFLAVVLPLYFALNSRWRVQNLLLIAAGYLFYGWWDWRFLGLLLLSTVADFSAGLAMGSAKNERVRKTVFVAVLCFNLGLLGVFKYFNFFAESFAVSMHALTGWTPSWTTLNVALPVGISFYTFQSIGYSIDVYRRQIPPSRDPVSYAAFVAFFPQLVAGPIERAGHLLKQMAGPRNPTPAGVWYGLCDFTWGLFKKLVVADYIAPEVDAVFADLAAHKPGAVVMATVAFAFQVYADFSAYSDMARGLARILGFDLVRNFDNPYLAASPQDFWHRWHMSLSGWFRDYLYFPLGGSRKGERRTHFNTLVVFVVSGLWHGAAWTYVLWGGLHGLGLSFQRLLTRAGITPLPKIGRANAVLGGLATFVFVCVGWYLFRAPSLAAAWDGAVGLFVKPAGKPVLNHHFDKCWLRASLMLLPEFAVRGAGFGEWLSRRRAATGVALLVVMIVAMTVLFTKKGVTFIYFQF